MRRMFRALLVLCCVSIHTLGGSARPIVDPQTSKIDQSVLSTFRILKPWIEQRNQGLPEGERISGELIQRVCAKVPSLADISTIAQKFFLRRPGTERWDSHDGMLGLAEGVTARLMTCFQEMGDIEAAYPYEGKAYKHILVLGGLVSSMGKRLDWLTQCIQERKISLETGSAAFLVGERDLMLKERDDLVEFLKDKPALAAQAKQAKTEADAAKMMAQWMKEKNGININVVVAQKKEGGNRPTTVDTVHAWMDQQKPAPGDCIIFSSQPFVAYQEIVVQGALGKAFSVDGAGPRMNQDPKSGNILSTLLDNLARKIYATLRPGR